MKILHIAYNYIDRLSYQENELPKMQAQLGHEVTMISTQDFAGAINPSLGEPVKNDTPYFIDGVKIIRLPLKYNVDFRFSVLKNLYQTICNENPDIIYFHGAAFFNLYKISKYKRKNPGCFLCMDFHGEYYNSAKNLASKVYHKYIFRYIIQSCLKYIDIAYNITPLVGQFTQEMYKIPQSKLKMLPLGFDPSIIDMNNKEKIRSDIRSALGIESDDIIIITGGKIDKNKNTVNLIKAIKSLNNNKLFLIIFGNVEEDYIAEIKKETDSLPFIHLVGWINPKEINDYYLASDIACFPGSQSVLWQQAIGCGLPICVKYYYGLEYLDLGGNVKFVYKDDHLSIAIALNELISDQDLIFRMRNIALEKGAQYFSYQNIAQTVINDSKKIL